MHRTLTALMVGLIVDAAIADTHYVDINSPGPVPPYNSGWGSAANTITAAIYQAETVNGDVVLVNTGVYVLAATINMNKSIAIIANSANRQNVVVDGASTYRCFYIAAGAAITGRLEGFTIRNGRTADGAGGGGILSLPNAGVGNLFTIANCTIISNTAVTGGGGGVCLHTNNLLTNCTIQANVSPSAGGGGVLCNKGAVIRNCMISGNTSFGNAGGGVYHYAPSGVGSAIMSDSVISNNLSGYYGGGVYMDASTVSNCTIVDNIVTNNGGGGCVIAGYGIMRNCTIDRNIATNARGGGVYFRGAGTIENCTIRDNTAFGSAGVGTGAGGGIDLYEKNCVVRNCLIVSNSAKGHGGGIAFSYGAAGGSNQFQNCTIADNTAVGTGGGLYLSSWAGVNNYVENTIVYFNLASANSNWFAAGVYSFTNSCMAPTNNHNGSDNIVAEPLFLSQGSASYHLTAQSPCINAGTNQGWMIPPGSGTLDLDGHARICRYNGDTVDIGAYEFIPRGILVSTY